MNQSGSNDRVVIPIEFGDGTKASIEARPATDAGRTLISGSTTQGFQQIVATIKSVANDLKGALDAAVPNEAEVEFGVDATLESGVLTALIVSGGTSASIKVTLRWKYDKATS